MFGGGGGGYGDGGTNRGNGGYGAGGGGYVRQYASSRAGSGGSGICVIQYYVYE